MAKVVLVTGASSGIGELTSYQLADSGHIVYASMHRLADAEVEKARSYSAEHGVDIRPLALDVQDQASVDAAVAQVIADQGRIDILVQNAGHMAFGPKRRSRPSNLLDCTTSTS
jgi:NAD(P)-dependent dehydrogenase (short-subunit alcohol dehydrogenase family)